MLISFAQTYSDKRKKHLEIYSRDKRLHDLKNLCDINLYSFHNCSDETVEYFKEINPIKNTEIIRFNDINMSYTQCIREIINIAKNRECTHFIFMEDDTFSFDNDTINFKELVDFIKEYDKNFMYCFDFTNKSFEDELPILKKLNTLTIYENHSLNLDIKANPFGFNGSAYVCTFDMLGKIYDEEYFKIGDPWLGEKYLRKKFSKEKIIRHIGNKRLFRTYNIIGGKMNRKKENSDNEENKLKQKRLL
jgi:hypothetical protein